MRKFEVGQRVRVWFTAGPGEKCNITKVLSPVCLELLDHEGKHAYAHPRQCVRLVRKKPCPPQGGEGKRRVWWLAVGEKSGKISQIDQDTSGSLNGLGPLMLPPCYNQDMPSWVRTVELKPGEVPVSREALAKVVIECPDRNPREIGGLHFFNELAAALGLEGGAK